MPPHPSQVARLRGQRVLIAAAIVVIVFGLRFAEAFIVPVIIGVMVAAVSSPLVNWLARRGFPTIASAALVLLLDIAVLGGVARLLLLAASDLQGGLPSYIAKFSALSHALERYLEHVGLHKFAAASWVSTEQSSGLLQGFISEVVSGASHVALVVFVVFFLLCELDSLGAKLRRLSDNADLQFERVDSIVRQVQLYLVVKLWTSVMSGVAAYMVLKLARVELALLLSLIFFILHFIPNIGAAIGTVAAIVFALVDRGVGTAAAVGCAFLLINTLIGNLVEPRMLGARLGVSPFAVLLGMLFWGWLWGPAGALLSVPILAATKIVLENIPDLAWISQLADTSSPERARAGHLGRLTQLGRLGEIAQRVSRVPPHDEPIGLGLGSHSATSRSAPRRGGPYETIPGFPQRQKSDPSPTVPSSPTTPSEPTPSAKS